jgi:hypothetical protein
MPIEDLIVLFISTLSNVGRARVNEKHKREEKIYARLCFLVEFHQDLYHKNHQVIRFSRIMFGHKFSYQIFKMFFLFQSVAAK